MVITDVLYVPEITHRLASTDTLNDNGYSILFSSQGPSLQIQSLKFKKTLLLPRYFDFRNQHYYWPNNMERLMKQKNMFPISPNINKQQIE